MKNNLQIWAIGDIHGSYVPVENFWRRNRGKQKFSPDKDVLVCLGDFGGNFYLNKGALIKTPTTISNDGKDNIITIEKENYISQHLHFNKELNDKTIILKKGNELVGILDIIVKQKRPIHVEFDNDQNYKAPVSILNVNLNKPHTLKVYPLYPNKNKSFVCNINLKNKKSRLSIDLISSSCSLGFTH